MAQFGQTLIVEISCLLHGVNRVGATATLLCKIEDLTGNTILTYEQVLGYNLLKVSTFVE